MEQDIVTLTLTREQARHLAYYLSITYKQEISCERFEEETTITWWKGITTNIPAIQEMLWDAEKRAFVQPIRKYCQYCGSLLGKCNCEDSIHQKLMSYTE